MTLYKLNEAWQELMDRLDEAETEEERAELYALLDGVYEDMGDKADAYARWLQNRKSDLDAVKAEIERLTRMKKRCEADIDRAKGMMLETMQRTGQTELVTDIGRWRVQKNPWSCVITDEAAVPERFKSVRTETVIDKAAMLREFKSTGEEFDGCVMQQTEGVRFR